MSVLHVAPIVEGHGEYECVRILVQRVWREVLDAEHIEVLRPIRGKKHRLVKKEELQKAVKLALSKLADAGCPPQPGLLLILLDADTDAPCLLGPQLLRDARDVHPVADMACVIANREYETWFVAAAESLVEYLDLSQDTHLPETPEDLGLGKGWIETRFRGTKYSETQDQPRMTAKMDL
ncbi:MAG: DUF4276 family protein, partial [Thermoguttaceae bacterium]|nr:DUF4276 family protein [Thermoguttaceae bacterium]